MRFLTADVARLEHALVRQLLAEQLLEHLARLRIGAALQAAAVLVLGGAFVGDGLLQDREQVVVAQQVRPVVSRPAAARGVAGHRSSLVILRVKVRGKSS